MQPIVSVIAEIIAIFTAIAGGIVWYVSKLLSHKKDMLILQLQLEQLLQKIKELETEVDLNRREFEHWKDGKNKNY